MLTIYSASAGTGKTHTLTGAYLSLLFRGNERHRHILAVTFTNKATAEMKSRIIEELFSLADDQPSNYLELLSENGRKSETDIRRQARQLLIRILHDYSAFNISTIDRFFQQTIRAFTREIGLQGNYQIEMDEEQMMEEAVENMMSDLEKTKNTTLIDWLLRFTENKIEEGGSWDIRRDIIQLGRQLFKESYKAYSDSIQKDIGEKQRLADYRKKLSQIIRSTQQTAKELGEKGVQLMKQHGLHPSDLKGGSRSPFFFFEKLTAGNMDPPSATFCGLVDHAEGYVTKTATAEIREAAERIFANGMNELIRGTVAFFDHLTDYYTAVEVARNFYALGILTDLSGHIARWREDNNKMLIADTTELLHKVIDGSEIPFIYEKTGTRIEHYMIDEFQDTSAMQWANFRPLLKDSIDSGRSNLIVGDVKQSIYRFRNSDWTLLDHKVKDEFGDRVHEQNLDTNWRSCRRIVEFNNRLFEAVPAILQQAYNEEVKLSTLSAEEKERYQTRIVTAYANAEQHVARKFAHKDGHVRIQFLSDNDEQNWKEQSMEQLPGMVEQLQEQGYALRDIAILTRTGAEGLWAAETLLAYKEAHPESTYKYDIISEDSLTVSSSLSVRWMVEMLRYLNQPDNVGYYYRTQLAYAVLQQKAQASAIPEKRNEPPVTVLNTFLHTFPPAIVAALLRLANRSLYELTEGLFRLFETDFPENELVFVQAFIDMVAEYSMNETADTNSFLTWWDDAGSRKKIATPDSQNAIRIMTIHKSKGLGFKALIIPFADWKVDQKDTILWCHPTQSPFDTMSLVPVRYGKTLKNTLFAADYFKEKLHAYMDNLNTLYVACTRAKEELIIVAPRPKTETVSIANLLWKGVQTETDGHFDPSQSASAISDARAQTETDEHFDLENGYYESGTPWRPEPEKSTGETDELPMKRFYSVSPDGRMQLRLRRKGGFFDDEKRKYGLLMHDILSSIEQQTDISSAVSEKFTAGEIDREEATLLHKKLITITGGDAAKHWFNGSQQVMNEAEILFGKGQSRRPDRVMIHPDTGCVTIVDYKFGEQKESCHRRQMERYIALIREMDYPKVEGFLWYITLNEVTCFS